MADHAISLAFALQVIGADGVADSPPEGSMVQKLVQCETEMRAAGASEAEISAALDDLLAQQDAEEHRQHAAGRPDGPLGH